MINFYKMYISAWANYQEDALMKMLRKYLDRDLDKISQDWWDIKYFHQHFVMKCGDYFGVDSDYAIEDDDGNIVWQGDYPTEQVIRDVLNNY